MEDKATLTNECCPYMHAQGTKFDDIIRVGSEFLQYDLPSNAIKVIGCSRKTQGMAVSFTGTYQEDGSIKTELRNKFIHTFKGTDQSLVSTTVLGSGSLLNQRFELFNAIAKGIKFDGQTSLAETGIENIKLGVGLSKQSFSGSISGSVLKCPIVSADAVVRYGDFLLGGQVNCCVAKRAIDSYSTGIAMIRPDYKISVKAENGFNSFVATYYQAVSSNMTVGYRATYGRKESEKSAAATTKSATPMNMEIAIKYMLNSASFIKAKVNQQGGLNLAISSVVSPGLRLVVGALIDTKNLHKDSHKMGLNVVFDA